MALFIDDSVMNGKKAICEYLKIDPSSIPAPRRKKFQMNVAIIDDKGTKRANKSFGGKAVYSIYVPHLGREVSIRWAITQKKVKDGVWAYTPKTIFLIPAENGEVEENDESRFLYWYLSPACRHSPFKQADGMQHYEYQDKNAEATKDLENEERYINAMNIIVGNNCWSDVQLRHLAKGLGVAGVDDMTPAVVKHHLKTLAKLDPISFYNKAQSREILFTGKIQECIDRGIFHVVDLNGMKRWYLLKTEVMPIQYTEDPATVLRNLVAEKYYLYADAINDALAGIDLKAKLDNAINDEAFDKEAKIVPIKVRAELTPEFEELLKEIRAKEYIVERMRKIDNYNLATIKGAQLASYESNKHYYEAWKAAKAAGLVDGEGNLISAEEELV